MGNFNRNDRSGSRGNFGQRNVGGRREMHQTVCSSCGKNCEVPFRPTGSKPVYCNDCFKNNGGGTDSRRFQDRGQRRPFFERRNESRPPNNEQLEAINRKLDKILEMLKTAPVKEEKEITVIAPKKTKTSKKKTPITKE